MKSISLLLGTLGLFACGASSQLDTKGPALSAGGDVALLDESNQESLPMSVYDTDFKTIRGEPLPFSEFQGKAVLVVNTASRCGYTGQYAGLQELYETFKDQEFVVLGVPSNDFGGQEPGQEAEIKTFCEINYGVTFPLTSKVSTIGENRHAFWDAATAALGDKAQPKWNFHKVLVSADGTFIQAYPSGVKPEDTELIADIERSLPR